MGYFLPVEALPHLKEYKYSSEDRSLLTKYVLKKFWIKFERIFPLSMAPNMVTLLGLVFIVGSLLLMFYYDPYYDQESPAWVYFVYSFSLFMYQTFDACDGIHARRTGQSGPLGELFDHCVDAINTTLSCLLFASVIGLGRTWLPFLSQFAVLTNFYLSTWEEYFTHTLFLSECSGPVEGILLLIALFIATSYYGQSWWKIEILTLDLSSLNMDPFHPISVMDFFIFLGGVLIFFNIYSARRNVLQHLSSEVEKLQSTAGLVPFFAYYLTVWIQLYMNPLMVSVYTIPIMLTIGSTIAFVVGRIIIGHLTKQPFPMINFPMFLPIFQTALIYILTNVYSFVYEDVIGPVVFLGLGLAIGIHGMFIIEIISEITNYLDIYALTIKHPKKLE